MLNKIFTNRFFFLLKIFTAGLLFISWFGVCISQQVYSQIQKFSRFYPDNHNLMEEFQGYMSGSDTIKHGSYVFYFPNGNKRQEGQFYNNMIHGEWHIFYETGPLHQIINFSENQRHGKYFSYYPEGNIMQEGMYSNDLLQSGFFSYYPDGIIESKVIYLQGIQHGEKIINYPDGKPFQIISMNMGAETGHWIQFHENGAINYKGKKINDQFADTLWVFYENGNLQRKGVYKEGVLDGHYFAWYDNGSIMIEAFYENGQLHGKYIEYFENGNWGTRGMYFENKREGEWVSRYPDKRRYTKGKFENNLFNGTWVVYHANGNLKQKGDYQDGKPSGQWYFFRENGSLEKSGNFINGLEQGIWGIYADSEENHPQTYSFYINGISHGPVWDYSGEEIKKTFNSEGKKLPFYPDYGYGINVNSESVKDSKSSPASIISSSSSW